MSTPRLLLGLALGALLLASPARAQEAGPPARGGSEAVGSPPAAEAGPATGTATLGGAASGTGSGATGTLTRGAAEDPGSFRSGGPSSTPERGGGLGLDDRMPVAEALKRQTDESVALFAELMRAVAMLGGLCVLAVIVAKVLGPRLSQMAQGPHDVIVVREARRLDPKTTLYLVEVAGEPLLLGVSEHTVQPLTTGALPAERVREALARKDAALRGGRSFASLLTQRGRAQPTPAREQPAGATDDMYETTDTAVTAIPLDVAPARGEGRAP